MLVHAAGESSKGVERGTYTVVLITQNESDLLKLEKRLIFEQVPHSAFREPDYNNQLMSIGIQPVKDRRMVQRYLKGFNLFGEDCENRNQI